MKVKVAHFSNSSWKAPINRDAFDNEKSDLVILLADRLLLEDPLFVQNSRSLFPHIPFVSCSTAGEIYQDSVSDQSAVMVQFQMEKTPINTYAVNRLDYQSSNEAGKALADLIVKDDLTYVMLFSDGGLVNGADLICGMNTNLPENVLITGGLAGDADRFESTLVGLNDNVQSGNIVAIAFYGEAISIHHGSMGGWESFGPERIITKSTENVLYEIDGNNALELYSKYLGEYAKELPMSALLFPLSLEIDPNEASVVRTILSVDFDRKSMTFAGNVPEGGKVRLMKANFDKLIDAAGESSEFVLDNGLTVDFAFLVSCVGRKLILKSRIDEEIEAVRFNLPKQTITAGFYSYGELSPLKQAGKCELHNQTMTITTFSEKL